MLFCLIYLTKYSTASFNAILEYEIVSASDERLKANKVVQYSSSVTIPLQSSSTKKRNLSKLRYEKPNLSLLRKFLKSSKGICF